MLRVHLHILLPPNGSRIYCMPEVIFTVKQALRIILKLLSNTESSIQILYYKLLLWAILNRLFQIFYNRGVFPDCWEIIKIQAILGSDMTHSKKGFKFLCSDYGPISMKKLSTVQYPTIWRVINQWQAILFPGEEPFCGPPILCYWCHYSTTLLNSKGVAGRCIWYF